VRDEIKKLEAKIAELKKDLPVDDQLDKIQEFLKQRNKDIVNVPYIQTQPQPFQKYIVTCSSTGFSWAKPQ